MCAWWPSWTIFPTWTPIPCTWRCSRRPGGWVDCILNVVTNENGEVVKVVAGDVEQAWKEAVAVSSALYEVPVVGTCRRRGHRSPPAAIPGTSTSIRPRKPWTTRTRPRKREAPSSSWRTVPAATERGSGGVAERSLPPGGHRGADPEGVQKWSTRPSASPRLRRRRKSTW